MYFSCQVPNHLQEYFFHSNKTPAYITTVLIHIPLFSIMAWNLGLLGFLSVWVALWESARWFQTLHSAELGPHCMCPQWTWLWIPPGPLYMCCYNFQALGRSKIVSKSETRTEMEKYSFQKRNTHFKPKRNSSRLFWMDELCRLMKMLPS